MKDVDYGLDSYDEILEEVETTDFEFLKKLKLKESRRRSCLHDGRIMEVSKYNQMMAYLTRPKNKLQPVAWSKRDHVATEGVRAILRQKQKP